jgi:hypothetical protein
MKEIAVIPPSELYAKMQVTKVTYDRAGALTITVARPRPIFTLEYWCIFPDKNITSYYYVYSQPIKNTCSLLK